MAGGICNPATNETIIGAIDCGVIYNGKPANPSQRTTLKGSLILASRSEVKRGEWQQFQSGEYQIRPMGSVAYKLGLVSAGLADVTFTLTPKNEWDVAAGAALVASAGGFVSTLENTPLQCNRKNPLLTGLLASGPFLKEELLAAVQSSSAGLTVTLATLCRFYGRYDEGAPVSQARFLDRNISAGTIVARKPSFQPIFFPSAYVLPQ